MGKQKTALSSKQKIIKKIKKQLIDVMSEDVCEEVQKNFQTLVTAAKTLYNKLQKIEDQEGAIAQVEKQAKKKEAALRTFFSTKENLSLLLKDNRKESKQQKVINDVLKYIHEFELALDKFLNRKVQLVWVDEQGNLLVATEDEYNKLLSTATATQDIRGHIAENAMRTLKGLDKYNNTYIDEALKEFEQSINNRRSFYQLALKRYEANIIEENGEKKPQKYFYWERDKKKDHVSKTGDHFIRKNYVLSKKINNKGRMAEAYVESIINDDKNEYLEVNNWLRHLNSLIYEDNVSAILRGDVIKKIINENTGNSKLKQYRNTGESKLEQHFAVKSGSWDIAGIRQYLLLAERLLEYEGTQISPALFRIGLPMLLTKGNSDTIKSIKSNIVESTAKTVTNKVEKQIDNTVSDRLTNLLNIYFENTANENMKEMKERTAILSASLNIKLEI